MACPTERDGDLKTPTMTDNILIIIVCSGFGIYMLWVLSRPWRERWREKERRDRRENGSGGSGGDSPSGDLAVRGNSRATDGDGGGDGGGGGGGD